MCDTQIIKEIYCSHCGLFLKDSTLKSNSGRYACEECMEYDNEIEKREKQQMIKFRDDACKKINSLVNTSFYNVHRIRRKLELFLHDLLLKTIMIDSTENDINNCIDEIVNNHCSILCGLNNRKMLLDEMITYRAFLNEKIGKEYESDEDH